VHFRDELVRLRDYHGAGLEIIGVILGSFIVAGISGLTKLPLNSAIFVAACGLAMGFNKRKMEDRRRQAAEKKAAARRATEKQILEDADYLVAVWNERQAKRMPMLFSPTIGAAITAGY